MGWSTTVVAGIWATCVAALFMAVGFSIPFWLSFQLETQSTGTSEKETVNAYIGVWYVMACIKGEADSCKTDALEPDFSNSNNDDTISGNTQEAIVASAVLVLGRYVWWWVVQIVSTVGLGFVLLATLILMCCRCAGIHSKGFFVVSAVLLFLGGLISLTISVLTAIAIAVIFDFVVDKDITAETFPWSLLCFGVGGLLALIAAVIIMYVTCKWKSLGDYISSDSDSEVLQDQPMSNLSKSYDRPRKYEGSRYDYDYDKGRDFSRSKKYRDTGRDYDRDYSRSSYRDHDRTNQAYDQSSNDRAYDKSYSYDYDYDRTRGYSQPRTSETMYRPYDQYRY